MDWKIQENEWSLTKDYIWHGILYRDAGEGEVEGKFLDIEGLSKEEAVLNGMNYILKGSN
jgi:hypothetical protein